MVMGSIELGKKQQHLPIKPVVGTIGGTPLDIMGTRAPTDMGTGATIPILGMPVGKYSAG